MTSFDMYVIIGSMRADRLVAMLLLLQNRGRMNASTIASELEVSVRTVHRDIEALALAGVPITTVRGPEGGFELWGGFRTQLTGLDEDEARALPLLSLPEVAGRLGLGPARDRAELKLLESLPPATAAAFRGTPAEFFLDIHGAQPEPDAGLVDFLAEAIRRRRVVIASGLPGHIHPLGLVVRTGEWYLVYSGERGVAALPIVALGETRTTGARFERPERFELATWWRAWVRRRSAERR